MSEQLTIVLKKGDRKTNVVEYERGLFDIAVELEIWDIRRSKTPFPSFLKLFMTSHYAVGLWLSECKVQPQSSNCPSNVFLDLFTITEEPADFIFL